MRGAAAIALFATLGGATPVGSLEVRVENLRSTKGLIRVCLVADPSNFPSCADDRRATKRFIDAANPVARFDGVASGTYAIAALHDENSNRKLDRLGMIPKEGVGFSRNPKLGFGPPKFSAARFSISAGSAAQTVRMKYFL